MSPDPAERPRWVGGLLGRPGVAMAFVWGAAEGSVFFLVPDIIITLAALFSARESFRHLAAVTAGSVLAGLVMYQWADRDPMAARAVVARVPFVTPAMFETVARDLEAYGAWGLCKGPMSGIPYKVYAVEAPPRVGLTAFVAVSVPARLERLLLSWVLFASGGLLARPRTPRGRLLLLGAYAAYWVAVYAYYWGAI